MEKIAILGAGAFGFAMAKLVSENNTEKKVCMYDVNADCIKHIQETRRHPYFHENIVLPDNLCATTELHKAITDADLIVLAVPSQFLRQAVREARIYLTKDTIFLNVAKGLEAHTNLRMTEVLQQELKDVDIRYEVCCLGGGMIAKEVTLQSPLCAEIACQDRNVAKKVARMLWSDHLRIETTDDVAGVELAGSFKNVVAIGAGIFDGLGYSASSKSAFVSSVAQEVMNLAISLGAKPKTYGPGGQAWFGDLITTCFGQSRNREFGQLIGEGMNAEAAYEKMKGENKSVEGYVTAHVIKNLATKNGLAAPLLTGINDVLYNSKDPKDFVRGFITSW